MLKTAVKPNHCKTIHIDKCYTLCGYKAHIPHNTHTMKCVAMTI